MTGVESRISDHEVEQIVGRLLQLGVLLAASVTLVGGIMLLVHHGAAPAAYSVFQGEPAQLRSLTGIIGGAFGGDAKSIVQLGLVLLIATPVLRVALSVVFFLAQRDWLYAGITVFVLAVLLLSLIVGVG